MINLLKSQCYLILRTKKFYIFAIICFLLIILAGVVLYVSGKQEATFPYDNARFYYINVLGFSGLLILLCIMVNQFVHSKEFQQSEKVSIAYDISKQSIYFGKFLAVLCYFSIVSIIAYVILLTLGINLFEDGWRYSLDITISFFNMAPIIFGALATSHALYSSRYKTIGVLMWILFIFLFSKQIFYGLMTINKAFAPIYRLTPQYLLDQNMQMYMLDKVHIDLKCWLVGLSIGIFSLILGYVKFKKVEY